MAESEENTISVYIKTQKDKKSVSVPTNASVKELRAAVGKEFETELPQLCLIFSGKILKDDESLESAGIKDGLVVHLVIKSPRPASETQQAQQQQQSQQQSQQQQQQQPQQSGGGQQAPGASNLPMPELFRTGVESGGSLADMQTQMQREMLRNPQMMRQMLDNPLVQSIMSNPDTMRAMIQSNPQMRDLMDRNPELNSLLNNPEVLRQTMELARSPAAMEEMSRNYDRALSNLESIPGGFGHLQRMYRDIQEPMLSATEESLSRNPFASLAGASRPTGTDQQGTENNQPLPNPWASGSQQQPQQQSQQQQSQQQQSQQQQSQQSQQPGIRSLQEQLLQANPDLLSQAMQAPYMQSMMQAMAANPQLAESMLVNSPLAAGNPQLQEQLRLMLPQMMAQMSNPQTQSALRNPRALQAIMQIQENLRVLQQEAPELVPGLAGGMQLPATAGTSASGSGQQQQQQPQGQQQQQQPQGQQQQQQQQPQQQQQQQQQPQQLLLLAATAASGAAISYEELSEKCVDDGAPVEMLGADGQPMQCTCQLSEDGPSLANCRSTTCKDAVSGDIKKAGEQVRYVVGEARYVCDCAGVEGFVNCRSEEQLAGADKCKDHVTNKLVPKGQKVQMVQDGVKYQCDCAGTNSYSGCRSFNCKDASGAWKEPGQKVSVVHDGEQQECVCAGIAGYRSCVVKDKCKDESGKYILKGEKYIVQIAGMKHSCTCAGGNRGEACTKV